MTRLLELYIKTAGYWLLTRMWSTWNFHTLLMGIRNGSATWENLTASCKVKHALYNLVFLQTDPREMTTYIHTKICTEMCRVALFILFKNWHTQISLTEEWLNTLIDPYNGLIVTQQQKGTKPQIHTTMWVKLTCSMLRESNQCQKAA